MSDICIHFRLSWVNRRLIRLLARGFVRVDKVEHLASWTNATTVEVASGPHLVEAFLRYKGFRAELGVAACRVQAPVDGTPIDVTVHGSWLNNAPFRIRTSDTPIEELGILYR